METQYYIFGEDANVATYVFLTFFCQSIPGTKFERMEAFPSWNDKEKERDDVYTNVIERKMARNGDSVFVMAFRDPIERILSHYEFEFKWGCNPCCHTNSDLPQPLHNDTVDGYSNMDMNSYLMPRFVDKWWEKDGGCKLQSVDYKSKFGNVELEDLVKRISKFESLVP